MSRDIYMKKALSVIGLNLWTLHLGKIEQNSTAFLKYIMLYVVCFEVGKKMPHGLKEFKWKQQIKYIQQGVYHPKTNVHNFESQKRQFRDQMEWVSS